MTIHEERANLAKLRGTFPPKTVETLRRQLQDHPGATLAWYPGLRKDGTISLWLQVQPAEGAQRVEGEGDPPPLNESHTCPPFTDC